MAMHKYIAVDLGAESGRVMVGTLAEGKIALEEVHRFPNVSVKVAHKKGTTWHWDVLRLWHEIQAGIAKATGGGKTEISGIGIDTWGVDFGLLGDDGQLLANPVCYRDGRTTGMQERVYARCSQEKLYGITGIQSMFFNTVFQLASLSMADDALLKRARHLLFMPDLIAFWLTGKMFNEYTFASTTMMLDAKLRAWSPEILEAIDVKHSLFPDIIMPATTGDSVWGHVLAEVGDGIGATGTPVLAVGSHDTASAVAAVPATGGSDDWLYISSGTWSLMGAEVAEPVLIAKAGEFNLTNEGGIGGTIRLLKNVAGMWFIQQCRQAWAKNGLEFDYGTLAKLAEEAQAHTAIIDPEDAAFQTPGDMPEKIMHYCQRTDQVVPGTPGQMVRVILESLAVAYAKVKHMLEEVTGKTFTRLHIVGGGCQNHLLNQLAADATGMTVVAGPVEATALGNIMSQAISTKQIHSIHEGREIVAKSAEVKVFEPRDTERWARYTKRVTT